MALWRPIEMMPRKPIMSSASQVNQSEAIRSSRKVLRVSPPIVTNSLVGGAVEGAAMGSLHAPLGHNASILSNHVLWDEQQIRELSALTCAYRLPSRSAARTSSERSKTASELHPTYDGPMISPGGARRTRGRLFTQPRRRVVLRTSGHEQGSGVTAPTPLSSQVMRARASSDAD